MTSWFQSLTQPDVDESLVVRLGNELNMSRARQFAPWFLDSQHSRFLFIFLFIYFLSLSKKKKKKKTRKFWKFNAGDFTNARGRRETKN